MTFCRTHRLGQVPRHSDQRRSLHVSGDQRRVDRAAHRHETTPRVVRAGFDVSTVAAKRALACAGVKAEEIDLILTVRAASMNMYRTPRPVCGGHRREKRGGDGREHRVHQFSTACPRPRRLPVGRGEESAGDRGRALLPNSWIGKIAMSGSCGDGAAAAVFEAKGQRGEGVIAGKSCTVLPMRASRCACGGGASYANVGIFSMAIRAGILTARRSFKKAVTGMARAVSRC